MGRRVSTEYVSSAQWAIRAGLPAIARRARSWDSCQDANAATITLDGTARSATGTVRMTRSSLADGTLGPLQLPVGEYEVLVEPATLPSGATEGITGLHVTVSSAGELLLPLAPLQKVIGQVTTWSGANATDALIRLRAQTGGAFAVGKVDQQGGFSVLAPMGVPLEIIVDPPSALPLAGVRRLYGSLGDPLGTSPPTNLTIELPKGLAVGGYVRRPNADPIVGATVDALCSVCGDQTTLTHAESNASGYYTVFLPDPGVANVDAGSL